MLELPEAMEEINDYIKIHDKEKGGWLRMALDRNGRPVFVPNGLTDELGYSVGQVSEAEYIFWRLGKLYKVTNGVASELPYTLVTKDTGSMDGGKWYVVEGVVGRTGSISVSGSANLVLLDGASLTVDCSGVTKAPGIEVEGESLLRVFGVESGFLTAIGSWNAAGIGTAWKLYGAAWDCHDCGHIEIYGGTVTATGGDGGAGIGGGYEGAGGTVTINGGTVTAYGNNGGASIGAGCNGGSVGSLTLGPRVLKIDENHWAESDAVVTFNPGQFGLQLLSASVDGGRFKQTLVNETWICALEKGHSLTLNFAPAFLGDRIVGSSTVTVGPILEDTVLGTEDFPSVETPTLSVGYIKADAPDTVSARLVSATGLSSTMRDGWYVVTDKVTIATTEVSGKVNLILADGAKLTVNGGIGVDKGNTLTIYAQQGGSGELIANGAKNCAGIGGRNPNMMDGYGNCGNVIIYGGVVTATGGDGSAGIGGGYKGTGGMVTINGISPERSESPSGDGYQGCTVTATGGVGGAGIGGGNQGKGGTVTILGGSVTAKGGSHGAGIGGGAGGTVTINGGTVTISGGSVTATGGNHGAGIGGGYGGAGGMVAISGGTVTATGGEWGAGIGGGYEGDGDYVWISGGTVTARGLGGGKGIGGGLSCDGDGELYWRENKNVELVDGKIGSDYVKFAEKPICDGGSIARESGVWVVTPNAGVTEITIAKLPTGDKVAVPPTVRQVNGVNDDEKILVWDDGKDITKKFVIANGRIRRLGLAVIVQ